MQEPSYTREELKQAIAQDMLRYEIRKPVSWSTFFNYFYIQVVPGLKYTIVLRYCQYYRRRNRLLFYFFFFWLRRLKHGYGIDISYRTNIGKGLYIGHFGGIVIHGDTVIGENCNLSQNMTIGVLVRGKKSGVPTIGDRVFIGPGAVILGGINIGNDALIGANSLVTFDVPDHAVVSAQTAQIVSDKGSSDYIINTK
ncbi:serine acetyltransferase [Flavobacterium sp. CYK-55]|uniref:serine O-acetyltransferase n=1 Tax=Flavobacterium sp. CYK-55 TaxID=2835529 RepID=UPI001BCC03CB|nr:serine acetyltransferase [Flavobacterium sp. CYK-55]MBS7786402.1 serine acetyltransferase [Flavobacterium sp. CYK-55]